MITKMWKTYRWYKKLALIKLLLLLLIIASFLLSANLDRLFYWSAGNPVEKISKMCYVTVSSNPQFIPFKNLEEQTLLIPEGVVRAEDGDVHWKAELVDGQMNVIYYYGWLRSTNFSYTVTTDNTVTPLSCKRDGGLFSFLTALALVISALLLLRFVLRKIFSKTPQKPQKTNKSSQVINR